MAAPDLRLGVYSKLVIYDEPGMLVNSDDMKVTGLRPGIVFFM